MKNLINKSELMKKAWDSFKFFNEKKMTVTFAQMLKRAWGFAKAALKPIELDLSSWAKRS